MVGYGYTRINIIFNRSGARLILYSTTYIQIKIPAFMGQEGYL